MTVQELYAKIEGDYFGVRERLMNDALITKFLEKYLSQTDHQLLHTSLEEKSWTDAFRAVHTMKGVALNLGFTSLAGVSSVLCEALRSGEPTVDVFPLLEKEDAEQQKTIDAIQSFLGK